MAESKTDIMNRYHTYLIRVFWLSQLTGQPELVNQTVSICLLHPYSQTHPHIHVVFILCISPTWTCHIGHLPCRKKDHLDTVLSSAKGGRAEAQLKLVFCTWSPRSRKKVRNITHAIAIYIYISIYLYIFVTICIFTVDLLLDTGQGIVIYQIKGSDMQCRSQPFKLLMRKSRTTWLFDILCWK